jgi:hypothetical protein
MTHEEKCVENTSKLCVHFMNFMQRTHKKRHECFILPKKSFNKFKITVIRKINYMNAKLRTGIHHHLCFRFISQFNTIHKLISLLNMLAPKWFFLVINSVPWPTSYPHPTLVKKIQNSYCMSCVTLQWLSQTSCIFPFPALVLEIDYFTPWRLSPQWNI